MWRTQPNYSLDDLSQIKARTLIMAGEFDTISREHTARLAKAIPRSQEVIVKGATHAVPNDKPDLINDLILRFLDQSAQCTVKALMWSVNGSLALANLLAEDRYSSHPRTWGLDLSTRMWAVPVFACGSRQDKHGDGAPPNRFKVAEMPPAGRVFDFLTPVSQAVAEFVCLTK
jgi:hypothetical protein